jgi:hypothetical protein
MHGNPDFTVVFDDAFPPVDRPDCRDVLAARGEPVLKQYPGESGQPVSAVGRDDDLAEFLSHALIAVPSLELFIRPGAQNEPAVPARPVGGLKGDPRDAN